MKKHLVLCCLLLLASLVQSQTLYFPPLFGSTWEATEPAELGWCTPALDDLQSFLDERDTKAFIILKDGKRVIEWYFDDFVRDSLWYWASAGKSMTATLVGIAQEEGLLSIEDPTQNYLGTGWTSLTAEQEAQITIRHQLTMTTGLNDLTGDADCYEPTCLTYLAEPGTRWAYHNAPYTLLGPVLEAAAGMTDNQFYNSRIATKIGAIGAYITLGNNRVFISRARDMARFGLMILANGRWNNTTVLGDMDYLTAMTTPSQALNPSYGYLWWLNGQSSHLQPVLQFSFPGPIIPSAPADMYAALGKNDQKLYIVPSQGLVVVRLGEDATDGLLALSDFDPLLWDKINALACTSATFETTASSSVVLAPNPATTALKVYSDLPVAGYAVFDLKGRLLHHGQGRDIDISQLPKGIYGVRLVLENGTRVFRKVVVE